MFAVRKLINPLETVARIGRMNISSTSALFEKFNILVPPMGESIKNGFHCLLKLIFRYFSAVGEATWRVCRCG